MERREKREEKEGRKEEGEERDGNRGDTREKGRRRWKLKGEYMDVGMMIVWLASGF